MNVGNEGISGFSGPCFPYNTLRKNGPVRTRVRRSVTLVNKRMGGKPSMVLLAGAPLRIQGVPPVCLQGSFVSKVLRHLVMLARWYRQDELEVVYKVDSLVRVIAIY